MDRLASEQTSGWLSSDRLDVAICGGGLAGLCAARQLSLELPELTVAVLDRSDGESPTAAFKVGESSIEASSHYLGEVLRLQPHLDRSHLRKFGLRYFFPAAGGFGRRPEVGLKDFDPFPSYQIDRGILENAVRAELRASGVPVLTGASVVDIELNGPEDFRVIYERLERPEAMRCRWLIDATGRHRLLQRKLGLTRPAGHGCSAAWFRVSGRVDPARWVSGDDESWHGRVARGQRWLSTNHLMGRGRWIWIIPLGSECTSIGIVTRQDVVPIAEYSTFDRALAWLAQHEPDLHAELADRQPLDFHVLRNYSYGSHQAFSTDGWACIGDASMFADPLFSPGMDEIGIGATMAVDLIARARRGAADSRIADRYHAYLEAFNEAAIRITQPAYPCFDKARPMAAKLLWNTVAGWAVNAPQRLNRTYIDDDLAPRMQASTARAAALSLRMERLFEVWANLSPATQFEMLDYSRVTGVSELYARSLRRSQTAEQLQETQALNLRFLESLALAIFRVALVDTGLETDFAAASHRRRTLNPWALSLNPDDWRREELFEPGPRLADYDAIMRDIACALRVAEPRDWDERLEASAHEQ